MAMAEGAVGTASNAPAFALPVNVSNNVEPPNTTLSAFAVRRDGEGRPAEIASTEEGLYVVLTSLNSERAFEAMQGKRLPPQPFLGTVAASAQCRGSDAAR